MIYQGIKKFTGAWARMGPGVAMPLGVSIHWTGLLDWTTGLDDWTDF